MTIEIDKDAVAKWASYHRDSAARCRRLDVPLIADEHEEQADLLEQLRKWWLWDAGHIDTKPRNPMRRKDDQS